MKINEIIRKYRKEKKLTQEEMANKLGVSAPAVNKWESGVSMPDITLLAPIARLLSISLDELLSFNDTLSDKEVSNIVKEISVMFASESIETTYQKVKDIVSKYPNEDKLILTLASMLNANCQLQNVKNTEKYDKWIKNIYENLLSCDDKSIKTSALESLYYFFLARKMYDKAEECIEHYPDDDPSKKRKLATLYSKKGMYDKAYKSLEEALFSDYQKMYTTLYELYTISIDTKNYDKALSLVEKLRAFTDLFEMGKYHNLTVQLDFCIAKKDVKKSLDIMDSLLSNFDTIMDYQKSDLFEHIAFNKIDANFFDSMRKNLIKNYNEDEKYEFLRQTPEWEAFKKKWS